MGGKPLKNLFCCYQPKAENMGDELQPVSENYNIEQINSKQTTDLLETDERTVLINGKCTYKRNESPQPVEVTNMKLNDIKSLKHDPFVV
uniref:Uncharacterized protein n=1 Tax=Wuchereria bancrofti TaxID=6293 RepID=A0A1I8ECD9_WUCBA